MKKIVLSILAFLLLSISAFSQISKIKIVDEFSLKPIEGVELYDTNNYIGKTDKSGSFVISESFKLISLIKEKYYDTIVNTNQNKFIKLKPIKAINLNEVIVSPLSVKNILDSIYTKGRQRVNIGIPKYFRFKNYARIETDTVVYLNELVHLKKGFGFYVNQQNKIVNKFDVEKHEAIVNVNNNSIALNKFFIHIGLSYFSNNSEFVTKYHNLFDFEVVKNDGLYKITFKPKKRKSEYPYEGFLLVDAEDFGIYEFNFYTTETSKRNLDYENKLINFKFLYERQSCVYKKTENGLYEMVNYFSETKLEILNGFFKGKVFENICSKETILNDATDSGNLKKFDLSTYELIL
jgi:hypothetical protein